MRLAPNEIYGGVLAAGWTIAEAAIMTAVILAESGGDTEAMGRNTADGAYKGSRDLGLCQINNKAHAVALAEGNWRNPVFNLSVGYRVFVNAGRVFTPWSVFKSGAYLDFLPDATIAIDNPWKLPSGPALAAQVTGVKSKVTQIRSHFV